MKKAIWVPVLLVAAFFLAGSKKSFGAIVQDQHFRGCDPDGCGHFGASRSGHTHQGIDIEAEPGETVFSPISGTIIRVAYPYASDLKYKGLEIANDRYSIKIFYIDPVVMPGTKVKAGMIIGKAQNIAAKYSAEMSNHVHLEVRETTSKKIIDPTNLF